MKRPWTRSEKWLMATPLSVGILVAGMIWRPRVVERTVQQRMNWPHNWVTSPNTQIRSMALSRNGELLTAAGGIYTKAGLPRGSGTVYLWNARTSARLASFPPRYGRSKSGFRTGFDIYALTLSPDATRIGFSRVSENWTLYDVAQQKQLWQFGSFVSDAEFSQSGRFIALSGDANISIVKASDGKIKTHWNRSGPANSKDLTWSPDESLIVSIGPYKEADPIELHQASDGKLVRRIKNEFTTSVAFSPDGKRLITARSATRYSPQLFNSFAPVRCYNVDTGTLVWEVKSDAFGGKDSPHSAFCDAVFSPDGGSIAAYQYEKGQIFLLDSATGKIKTTLSLGRNAHSYFFVPPGLAFSPDGKRLFARGKESVLVWELQTAINPIASAQSEQ